MKIARKFTKAGQDVFSTLAWAKRTSKISNLDGSTVFTMNDAEIPADWSQLATDIMVSKYFRKAGVPQHDAAGQVLRDEKGAVVTGPERSAKQVVHRLAGCWRQWGERHGYFDSAEDAQAFYDELAYMLLHQMCAPNSPQWFNTGLNFAYGITGPAQGHWVVDPGTGEVKLADDAYTHPQPHACFIQSVEDDLVNPGGIMDLWVREARLFKYGSGTGTNFSRLRGEEEPLSGGGRSSGLMSWLKIGDRAAGAIKSGGTTRRAAKMVCLDLDHPDIEQFVNWKVREELKVASLVEGLKALSKEQKETADRLGLRLDYDFNGEAYLTVSGQNSNNSVRINNAFFDALDEGADWKLVKRIDGTVSKTMPARYLWDQISYAAWRCADPGVQFDTTINEWHTCPASGRINASNPCVTGDTLVATTEGYRRIADLVGQTVEIVNGDGRRVWVDRVFKTGHKPVYELKTAAGYRLKLTADHRVWTANRGDVPACELTVDDQIVLERPGFGGDFVPPAFGELMGAAVGDGCVTYSAEQDFLFVSLCRDESAVAERLRGNLDECKRWLNDGDGRGLRATSVVETATGLRVGTSVAAILMRARRYAILDGGSHEKRFTDAVFGLDRASQAAILRGLFTTDGTVADYGAKSQYVGLDSTSLTLLGQVQLLLLGFGIKAKIYENRRALGVDSALLPDGKGGNKAYAVRQVHSLRISKSSRVAFEKHIGFLPESAKAQKLAAVNARVETYTDRLTDRVASLTACETEDVFDLTEPESHHFVANGIVVHNCSEYMFLDNTACNLASLNLLKFYDSQTRAFDWEAYEHGVELWTMVLEISVLMAAFPSKEIARLSYEYRTLGLGYANIGAMLMQAGIPYDSEEARALCGALTAILTGRSYATSARMAAQLGPFPGYYKNREAMLRVMRNHRRAAHGVSRDAEAARGHEQGDYEGLEIKPVPIEAEYLDKPSGRTGHLANSPQLLARARAAWDDALAHGSRHGFRNAQTTVIAPTGTIGLLMDCDTTGVEPDFALVKFKKLAGGGYFKIANQSLEPALFALGYSAEQVGEIMRHVLGALELNVPMPEAASRPEAKSNGHGNGNGHAKSNGNDHGYGNGHGHGHAGNGKPAATFEDFLKAKGLTDAELEKLTKALPTVFELPHAFNAWTLGEEALNRLGLSAAAKKPGFNLLRALGLGKRQIAQLNRLICGTQTVEGAPHLKPEHLPVFDCANTCGPTGQRFIAPDGHIRMMAAAQPFISGAISKTINLPNSASVDDIKAAYRLSWELGLKANALYRDGCKLSQPLNSKSDADGDGCEDEEAIEEAKAEVAAEVAVAASHAQRAEQAAEAAEALVAQAEKTRTVEKIVERIVERPLRRRLPDTRRSITHKFNVAGHEGYLTVGLYEDGSPGELFLTMAKEGSTIGGIMDSLGTAISVALQYGVPVESLVTKFTHQRFEPAGMTHNPDIPFAKSLVDYIFRWMGIEFVPGYREGNTPARGRSGGSEAGGAEERSAAEPAREKADRIVRASGRRLVEPDAGSKREPAAAAETGDRRAWVEPDAAEVSDPDRENAPDADASPLGRTAARTTGRREGTASDHQTLALAMQEMQADAPACDVCGTITVRSGTCYKCLNCGNSMGCS